MTPRFASTGMLIGAIVVASGCGSGSDARSGTDTDSQRTGCAPVAPVTVAPGGYYVNGNTVCTGDGRAHLFHGVDRPSLEWSKGGEALRPADFARMASWKANVVRIPLNQDFWIADSPTHDPGYPLLVDDVVKWAEAAGMDVILDLHFSDAGTLGGCTADCQQKMPDRNSLAFWTDVAGRYAGDGRVLFELYNEPHDVSWDIWLSGGSTGDGWRAYGMQELYDAVRAAGADNLVIVGGLDWAYDLSGVPSHRVAGYNVVYAAHPYNSGMERRSRFWDIYWGALTATDPVIVTEFGDTATCAGDYAREVVDYADAHAAGWTAWAWFPHGCSFPSLVTDWTGTPSALGATVKEALSRYDDPPASAAPDGGTPAVGDERLTDAFDRSAEGWWLDDFSDPLLTNLGAGTTGGGAAAGLAFVATDGDPDPGALRLTATFTAVDQYAQAFVDIGSPGLNLAGKTLRARVRLASGSLVGCGVQFVASSGAAYDEADGPSLDASALPTGVWVPLTFALDQSGATNFDPAHVVGLAVRLRSAASTDATAPAPDGKEAVIEIDSVAD